MRKYCVALVFCLLLAAPAWAEYPRVGDELAVRIFCSGAFKGLWYGCGERSVVLITVPEAGGTRLLAAHIENESLPTSPYMLLRGPVAARWGNFRPAPGYSKDRDPSDSCRYWADRSTAKPGGRLHSATVEFDLGVRPPVLRSLDDLGRERVEPLERLAQSETAKLVARSYVVVERQTKAMRFRVLEANMGDGGEATRPGTVKISKLPRSPLLVALAQKGQGGRRVVRVLEASQWWSAVRILSAPAQDDPDGAFVFEAMAVDPNPAADNPEERRADLFRYEVTLDATTRTLLSSGWQLNVESDEWERDGDFRAREPLAKPGT